MPNKFVLINSQIFIVYSHAVQKMSIYLLYVLEFKKMLPWSSITPVCLAFRYLRNMRKGRKQVPEILVSKKCDFSVSLQGDMAICHVQKERRDHERPK
jgi:hypothetical protein